METRHWDMRPSENQPLNISRVHTSQRSIDDGNRINSKINLVRIEKIPESEQPLKQTRFCLGSCSMETVSRLLWESSRPVRNTEYTEDFGLIEAVHGMARALSPVSKRMVPIQSFHLHPARRSKDHHQTKLAPSSTSIMSVISSFTDFNLKCSPFNSHLRTHTYATGTWALTAVPQSNPSWPTTINAWI